CGGTRGAPRRTAAAGRLSHRPGAPRGCRTWCPAPAGCAPAPRAGSAGSDRERLGLPHQAQLARRTHVAEHRARGHHAGGREVALAAHAHAVRPVAVEARDRTLARLERVRALAEARAAPALADAAADRAEHVGDALAVEPRVGALDLLLHAARAREDHELPPRPPPR